MDLQNREKESISKKWYQKKTVWVVAAIVLLLLGVAGWYISTHVAVSALEEDACTVTIIGGEDGPTAIFLGGKVDGESTSGADSTQGKESTTDEDSTSGKDSNPDADSKADAGSGADENSNPDAGLSTLPLEMTMEVVDFQNEILTVKLVNQSGYDMFYGEDYMLEKWEQNQWATVIPEEDFSWIDIVTEIKDLEEVTVDCNLCYYGKLQAGKYRVKKSDMYAEFELDEDGRLVK